MPFPLAALAIMAGAKAVGGLLKKKGQASAAKEQFRADSETANNKFASDTASFDNRENDRLARTQGIAQQLQGARALSPEVIQAALARRKNTAYKGSPVDQSKGIGFQALGDVAGQVGDYAGAYAKGSQMEDGGGAPQGAIAQSIQAPINAPCPPGQMNFGEGCA